MSGRKKSNRKKLRKNPWLASTIIVLIIVFIASLAIGIWRLGLEIVFDESLKYIIGCTFTGIVVAIVSVFYTKSVR